MRQWRSDSARTHKHFLRVLSLAQCLRPSQLSSDNRTTQTNSRPRIARRGRKDGRARKIHLLRFACFLYTSCGGLDLRLSRWCNGINVLVFFLEGSERVLYGRSASLSTHASWEMQASVLADRSIDRRENNNRLARPFLGSQEGVGEERTSTHAIGAINSQMRKEFHTHVGFVTASSPSNSKLAQCKTSACYTLKQPERASEALGHGGGARVPRARPWRGGGGVRRPLLLTAALLVDLPSLNGATRVELLARARSSTKNLMCATSNSL